jgi:dUTP pyrophosphatase
MVIDIIVLILIILYLLFVTTFLSAATIGILWQLYQMKGINEPKNIKFKLIKDEKKEEEKKDTLIPKRSTLKSAGFDLKSSEDCIIPAKSHKAVKTGIIVSLPPNSYGRIASRSGLSLKHGIEVGAGVIDEDYRNEIMVILYNHSDEDFMIKENDRIAQLIVQGVIYPNILLEDNQGKIEALEKTCLETIRKGGFGSTGLI